MDVHVATVRARSWSGNVPAPVQPLQGRSGHIVSAAAAVGHPAVGAVTESGKILEPGEVVDAVVANLAEGSISISPHHDVGALATTKAADPDAWLQRQGLPPGRG